MIAVVTAYLNFVTVRYSHQVHQHRTTPKLRVIFKDDISVITVRKLPWPGLNYLQQILKNTVNNKVAFCKHFGALTLLPVCTPPFASFVSNKIFVTKKKLKLDCTKLFDIISFFICVHIMVWIEPLGIRQHRRNVTIKWHNCDDTGFACFSKQCFICALYSMSCYSTGNFLP